MTESSALYYCVFGRVSSKSLSRVPMSDKKNGKSDMIILRVILTITCCLNLSSPPGLRTLDFSIPIGSDRTFISLSKFLRWAMRGRVARTPENFDCFKVSSASSYTSTHCAQEKVRAVVQVQLWNRYNFEFCFARLFSSETLFFVSTMLAMLLVSIDCVIMIVGLCTTEIIFFCPRANKIFPLCPPHFGGIMTTINNTPVTTSARPAHHSPKT